MGWSRYDVVDGYVLEELRREYEAADARGRILILRKLQKDDGSVPFEIAALATQDRNVQVRQWFARHGSYGVLLEREPWKHGRDNVERRESARRLLTDSLKKDADPFVRACLRENPAAFGPFHGQSHFLEATHMERLALMRNPEVDTELIKKVFDPQNTQLGIDMQARRELCRAFLTNKAKLHKLTDDAHLCPDHKGYWENDFDAQKFLGTLWQLAAKWPEDSDIPFLVFNEVPANGLTSLEAYEPGKLKYVKAEIYRALPRYRLCILYSCDWRDDEVVRLGLQDADQNCREAAYMKLWPVPQEWVEQLISRKDKAALKGLVNNESLSVEDLEKCQKCLDEIEPHGYPFSWITIERKKEATVSQDSERLFGKEGRGLLEEKINFIGKTVAEIRMWEIGAVERDAKLHKSLVWAQAMGVASILLLLYLILR